MCHQHCRSHPLRVIKYLVDNTIPFTILSAAYWDKFASSSSWIIYTSNCLKREKKERSLQKAERCGVKGTVLLAFKGLQPLYSVTLVVALPANLKMMIYNSIPRYLLQFSSFHHAICLARVQYGESIMMERWWFLYVKEGCCFLQGWLGG